VISLKEALLPVDDRRATEANVGRWLFGRSHLAVGGVHNDGCAHGTLVQFLQQICAPGM
jgi:hypothetical protein